MTRQQTVDYFNWDWNKDCYRGDTFPKDTSPQNPICVFTDSKFFTRQDFSPDSLQEAVKP